MDKLLTETRTCVRDVAEPFGVDGDIKSPVMAPDLHSGVSTAYSYADSGHAWNEADTRHGEELSDVQFSNICMPSTPRRFFACNNQTPTTQTFGYSNDPLAEGGRGAGGGGVVGGGSMYQAKTNQNTFQADANYFQIAATDNDISDGTHAHPRNQPEKVCHPSPPRPLPPVPHLGRARPNSQHFRNQQQPNVDQPHSQESYPVKPMQISQTGLKYVHQAVKSTAL